MHHERGLAPRPVVARVVHIQREQIFRSSEHGNRKGTAHANRRLANDYLLGGAVVASKDYDSPKSIPCHLPAELLQPRPKEFRENIVFRVHHERMRLADTSDAAVDSWRYQQIGRASCRERA